MLLNTDKQMMSMRSARYLFIFFLCGAVLSLALGCGGRGGSSVTVIRNATPTIGAPASLIAYAGDKSVTITWSDVSGVDSYRIYRSETSPVTKVTGSLIVSGLTATTFLDTNVTNSTTYYYVMTSIMGLTESSESSEVSAVPGSTGGIQGTIRYEDREYGARGGGLYGFTGNKSWKTVRYASVDLVDNVTKAVLLTTFTDSMGHYSFATSPSTTQVYVGVNASATPPSAGTILVRNHYYVSPPVYSVPSDPFPLSGTASVNISIPISNTADGAFNVLDVLTNGYEFVKVHDGQYPVSGLTAYWYPGSTDGTYYCTGFGCSPGDGIYVYSETNGDTDEFDDDVLWHEFGHFMAATYSVDQSLGGRHFLTDNDHDLRFSWSEGWGNFVPGAIKSWLAANDPARLSTPSGQSNSLYVDTSGSSGWSFDFGLAPSDPAYFYASGEVAVAKVLLQLRSGFSMQFIWDIFKSFKTPLLTTPANLEFFWDRWIASYPTSSATVQSVFEERQIIYRLDNYEPDDALASAKTITVGVSHLNHTLYSDVDSDYAKFTPSPNTAYSIRTSSLRNGADTFLELYSTGSPTLSNDNSNNATYVATTPFNCNPTTFVCHENGNDILGSLISFTTPSIVTGPYTIRVKSSSLKPESAGRYGTYNLIVITSP